MTTNETFPMRLQRLRERKRISRRVLSELCGLHHDAVRRFELGMQEPTLQDLNELADFFEVSLDYLTCRKNYW